MRTRIGRSRSGWPRSRTWWGQGSYSECGQQPLPTTRMRSTWRRLTSGCAMPTGWRSWAANMGRACHSRLTCCARVSHGETTRVAWLCAIAYGRFMRNRFQMKAVVGVGVSLVAVLSVLTGCGLQDAANQAVDQAAEQAKDAVGALSADAASATVGAAVEQTLAEAGYTLSEPPACSTDLKASGIRLGLGGEATCTGETSTGSRYQATFDGLITLQGRCPGSLQVDIVGDPAVSLKRIDVCRMARLLEGG